MKKLRCHLENGRRSSRAISSADALERNLPRVGIVSPNLRPLFARGLFLLDREDCNEKAKV